MRFSTGRRGPAIAVVVAVLAVVGGAASAHTMVTPYDLPIPFSVYVYACAATLLLTFAVLSFVAADTPAHAGPVPVTTELGGIVPATGRVVAMGLLGLTIAAGFLGTPSPVANIGPNLFWVGLMLGLTAATVVVGDVFAFVNPWRAVLEWCAIGTRPRLRYPAALGWWPAFAWYLALEWLELMAPPRPSLLASALLLYTGVTMAGAALFGRETWLERAEFFGVFFRAVGTMASVAYVRATSGTSAGWRLLWRPPLTGAVERAPGHASLILFLLFMLAATTFDGVWQTPFWAGLYWSNLMPLLHPLWGDDMARAQAILGPGYVVYQRGGLIAAPFVYFGIYMAVMAMIRAVAGGRTPTRMLAARFAFSLVPIAVAYVLAHNWTFILTVLPVVPFLLTDPFGVGWNLLGLPLMTAEPGPLDMGEVWHVEVALILAGHVASVYSAHLVALRIFPTRRQAWLSELPLLALMMGYTFIGLSVLSLPLALH